MTILIYAVLAIAFLLLVLALAQKPVEPEMDEPSQITNCMARLDNGRWFDLSDRIFDPSDARWLAEELTFPKLANALIVERRRLAILWLEALQASFDELVRTPAVESAHSTGGSSIGSWQLLWLTLRFKLLISYALLVVKLFGPYHRLMPPLSWTALPQSSGPRFRRAVFAESRTSR